MALAITIYLMALSSLAARKLSMRKEFLNLKYPGPWTKEWKLSTNASLVRYHIGGWVDMSEVYKRQNGPAISYGSNLGKHFMVIP